MGVLGGTGGDFVLVAIVTAINRRVTQYKTRILTEVERFSR